MGWESVRDLNRMKEALVLVQSLAQQLEMPDEVMDWVEEVRNTLSEVMVRMKEGRLG